MLAQKGVGLMYEELIAKVKGVKPNGFSDQELVKFIEEALIKTCGEKDMASSGVNTDDALVYYVLSQISLFEGDLADYNNYCVLYNNAAKEFRRSAFGQVPTQEGESRYENLW